MLDAYVRKGFFALDKKEREDGKDIMWYIWLHPDSPLFGKTRWLRLSVILLRKGDSY